MVELQSMGQTGERRQRKIHLSLANGTFPITASQDARGWQAGWGEGLNHIGN